jgi:hypothetical protein
MAASLPGRMSAYTVIIVHLHRESTERPPQALTVCDSVWVVGRRCREEMT